MATGNLSPRQKMINLMYLVLIALLALQVSSEVMEAFAKMYERSEDAIIKGIEKNEVALDGLKQLSGENPAQYKDVFETGKKVKALSDELIKEIQIVKKYIYDNSPKDEKGKLIATDMGKSDVLDAYLFVGDKNSKKGKQFLDAVNKYRSGVLTLVENETIREEISSSFNTDEIKTDDGKKEWLVYSFQGLPTIGSIAVLSSMENTILNIGNEVLTATVSSRLRKATSASNLQAFVKLDKNTYSPGDNVTAEIFLASKDDSKVPNKVEVNGEEIDLKAEGVMVDGKVIHKFKAGQVGDRPIIGQFIFTEKGEDIPVEIKGNYSVVAGSNQAIVSADKMNVVYRGIQNPITISMPGISPTKVKASAPGIKYVKGSSYMLRPGKGKSVSINVTGTTDSGEKIKSPPVTFRIKDVPAPMSSIRGEYGTIKMPKTSLAKSSVQAGLPDFVFDLKLRVKSFKVKVPGKTTVLVNGGRMNAQAQKAIAGAKRGDIVTIFGMKAEIVGNSTYKLKTVLPISIEITN